MSEIMQQIANVAVGGILALLILREVFDFIRRRNGRSGESKRRDTPPAKPLHSLDAIVDRLDRIIDRLDDLADCMRHTRRQTELNGEQQDRVKHQLEKVEENLTTIEKTLRQRPVGPIVSTP